MRSSDCRCWAATKALECVKWQSCAEPLPHDTGMGAKLAKPVEIDVPMCPSNWHCFRRKHANFAVFYRISAVPQKLISQPTNPDGFYGTLAAPTRVKMTRRSRRTATNNHKTELKTWGAPFRALIASHQPDTFQLISLALRLWWLATIAFGHPNPSPLWSGKSLCSQTPGKKHKFPFVRGAIKFL